MVPYYLMVLVAACTIPVYYWGLETSFIFMFSKGIIVNTWPMPEHHPQKRSLATSTISSIKAQIMGNYYRVVTK